ncbi:ABC transporter substrate-binding protein [Candidatus Sumerlaeota bacterium]|nr:ABC transporter substrate-binding protein [Candidatus Sumerlaeota bacterium]
MKHKLLLFVILILAPACLFAQDRTRVSLVLNWFPEMEHGGFYAAQVHNYYADEGLDVNIISGGVDVPVGPRVASQQAQFGVTNADNLIFARAAEANIVALMAPLQVSPRCIMVHESEGFKSFADLKDMTLAMNPKDAFSEYLKKNYPMTNIKIVPYPGSIAPFLNDKRFGQQGYNISEPFIAKQNGGDPKVLMLSDAGWNPYSSLLVTSDEYLAKNPGVARKMTRASIKGWVKYMEDPKKSNEQILKLNPELSMEILNFGVKEMQPMVYADGATKETVGKMTTERWAKIVQQMEDLKLIKAGQVKATDCFKVF